MLLILNCQTLPRFFTLAPEYLQTGSKLLYLWENTSVPLSFKAWICIRITSLPQRNYSIIYFETCFQTKAEWSLWTTSGQRVQLFLKDIICPLSRPFPLHFLEKQRQSHILFQLTLPRWFLLSKAETLTSSGGKTRKQWWSIFSFLSQFLWFHSGIIIVHDNLVFFSSHSIRLEFCVHLQFPRFLLHCATGCEAFITLLVFSGFWNPPCSCSMYTKTPLLEVGSLKILSYPSV